MLNNNTACICFTLQNGESYSKKIVIKFSVRSSHQSCSLRKGILRNFAKFTGKHLCQSLFFNKVAGVF